MKDRVLKDIGATTSVVEWATIDWKSVRKRGQGIEGVIVVAFNTEYQGNVTSVQLLQFSGNSKLDR